MNLSLSSLLAASTAGGGQAVTMQEITACKYLLSAMSVGGFWDSNALVYPLIGTDKINHSFNLVDSSVYPIAFAPADTSTHHTSGGWIMTNPASRINNLNAGRFNRDFSTTIYLRAGGSNANFDISNGTASTSRYSIGLWLLSNQAQFYCYSNTELLTVPVSASGYLGLWTFNNIGGQMSIYRNGVLMINGTRTTTAAVPNVVNTGLGITAAGAAGATGRTYGFFSQSKGIPPDRQAAYYTIMQTFQTMLGRNV